MNNQETPTFEEENENNARKHELIKLIDSGEAILIVGAGSSRRMGYPGWSCLVKKLEDLADKYGAGFKLDKQKYEDDPLKCLKYVEDIKSHILNETRNLKRYDSLLYDLFKPKRPLFDNFHKMLVSLPFRGILTTNYDTILEAALNAAEQSLIPDRSLVIDANLTAPVHEFLMEIIDKNMPRRIAHLHGRYNYPNSIILSSKDYQKAYGLEPPSANQVHRDYEWPLHRKLLWALLATRRAVFIGFSMEDPYINRILYVVSKDLWRWDKPIHYVISGISPDRKEYSKAQELKHDCGIDTVFYQISDNDDPHGDLYDIVAEIAEAFGVEVGPTIIPQEQSDDSDRSEDKGAQSKDKEPESIASESGDILDWLEQNNQRMERKIDDEN